MVSALRRQNSEDLGQGGKSRCPRRLIANFVGPQRPSSSSSSYPPPPRCLLLLFVVLLLLAPAARDMGRTEMKVNGGRIERFGGGKADTHGR